MNIIINRHCSRSSIHQPFFNSPNRSQLSLIISSSSQQSSSRSNRRYESKIDINIRIFSMIDLRWGITEEQSSHGDAKHMFNQNRSMPSLFYCMLGERSRWRQSSFASDDYADKLLMKTFDEAHTNFLGLINIRQKYHWVRNKTRRAKS